MLQRLAEQGHGVFSAPSRHEMRREDASVCRDGRVQDGDSLLRAPGIRKQTREDLRLIPSVPFRARLGLLDRLFPATAGDQQLGPQPEEFGLLTGESRPAVVEVGQAVLGTSVVDIQRAERVNDPVVIAAVGARQSTQ